MHNTYWKSKVIPKERASSATCLYINISSGTYFAKRLHTVQAFGSTGSWIEWFAGYDELKDWMSGQRFFSKSA